MSGNFRRKSSSSVGFTQPFQKFLKFNLIYFDHATLPWTLDLPHSATLPYSYRKYLFKYEYDFYLLRLYFKGRQ